MRVRVFTWMAALVVATGTLTGAAGPAAAVDVTVRIEDFQFRPSGRNITVGDRVIWVNSDDDQHRVESDEGSAVHFDSGDLDRDEQFSKVFDRAGTFRYHCRIHDSMNGVVEVAEAPTTTTAPPPTTTTAPPPTTTTEPPTTTTEPPATTSTEPPGTTTTAPATSTTRGSTSTTTSTTVPGSSTTTSSSTSSTSSSSTSSTSTTVTTVAAPAAVPPPLGPLAPEAVIDPPGGPDGSERGRNVVGSASGAVALDEGLSRWMVLGLMLFAAVALFGVWNLWSFRPSRT